MAPWKIPSGTLRRFGEQAAGVLDARVAAVGLDVAERVVLVLVLVAAVEVGARPRALGHRAGDGQRRREAVGVQDASSRYEPQPPIEWPVTYTRSWSTLNTRGGVGPHLVDVDWPLAEVPRRAAAAARRDDEAADRLAEVAHDPRRDASPPSGPCRPASAATTSSAPACRRRRPSGRTRRSAGGCPPGRPRSRSPRDDVKIRS